ncbi:hypothetical protein GCM10011504_28470 [Siccirubricoccus deserti]|uniref:YfhO family protein n=1 Tax=Siccirubricoccus deserti TaxID=2013562 RepID=A0A9X0UE15_9PROT|nr:hypothetical protein [Siccirubricoccus deserti]MBC4016243.1 hypothetical protein [Siccirubricoccus deserti]GGC48313.1 hypothetical protein GCM10011504_28470 [Siccirubricoccus deserti]
MRETIGLLVLVGLLALGSALAVPVVGKMLGRDADFALLTLQMLSAAWAEGTYWPRWLMDSNFGLGGTTFYSYPPLAFWAAAGVAATTGAGTPESLGLAMAGWRLLSVVTAALWLRRHVPARAAWAGAAFGALLPYGALVDPWVRFAYSETAAIALLPLLLMALEDLADGDAARKGGPGSRTGAGIPLVALAYAALALTNLPLCTFAAHLGPIYAWAYGGRRAALHSLLGGALGAALAAAFLLPAIGLLRQSNSAEMFNPSWRENLLGYTAPEARLLPIWGGGLIAFGCGLWLWRRAARTSGWRQPGLMRALPALLLGSFALGCVLTLPLWLAMPQLTAVEHPWRSYAFLTPAVSGFAALMLRGLPRGLLFGLGVPLALLPVALLAALGGFGHPHWPLFLPAEQRMDFARGYSGAYSWEHVPAAAAAAGWTGITAGAADPYPRPVPPPGTLRLSDGYHVPAAEGPFSLPQFYFPAWAAHDAQGPVALRANSEGLLEVAADRPVRDLVVRIRTTSWERAGWAISGATAAGLLVMLLRSLPYRRVRPRPGIQNV